MSERRAAWVAAILNHGGYGDLERCLAGVRAQQHLPLVIRVFDTGEDPRRFDAAAARHADVMFEMGANRGYAGGANHLLRTIDLHEPDADYVLLLNPDVELDPSFAGVLIDAAESEPRVALASGKLLRPGREVIDSAGIVLPRHRRPRDRGSDEPDHGQYDRREFVFAASGAALLAKRAALPNLALSGEIFDEDFFVYHEDTDLAWRAHLLGWRVLYEPDATAVHARGWRKSKRFDVAVETRRHSFKNHYLQLLKNERARGLFLNLPWLVGWEFARLGFALLRDREILGAYRDAFCLLGPMIRKRRELQKKIGGRPAR